MKNEKKKPKKLRFVSTETKHVVGQGLFKYGDEVTDPDAIEQLAGGDHPNPNFVAVEEE